MNKSPELNNRVLVTGAVLCFLSTVAFFLSFPIPETDYVTHTAVAEMIQNLWKSITCSYTETTLFFIGLYVIYCETKTIENDYSCLSFKLLSCLFCVLWLLSQAYIYSGSTEILTSTPGQILKSVIYLVGMYNVLYIFFIWIGYCVKCSKLGRISDYSFFETNCYLKLLVAVVLLWLPYYVICYPGNLYIDSWLSILPTFGLMERTSFSPVFFTAVLDFFINIGLELFGTLFSGIAIYTIIQFVLICLTMAYSLFLMVDIFRVKTVVFVITLVTIAFSPYYTSSINLVLKDVPYSFSLMLLVCQLCLLFYDEQMFFSKKRNPVLLIISICATYLFRNNGQVVAIVTVVVLSTYFVSKKDIKVVGLLVLPVVLSAILLVVVTEIGGYKESYTTEALSFPLQQTARIVSFFPDELTDEDIEGISGVANVEVMKTNYNPLISDPVKDSGNRYADREQILEFLKTWIRLVCRHPSTAISATLNQCYSIYFPFAENPSITVGNEDVAFNENHLIEDLDGLSNSREIILMFYYLMHKIPVIGLLSNQAIYTLIMVGIIFSLGKNKWIFVMSALPAIITVIGIIFAPAIQWFPRYVFPTIFSVPVLTAFSSCLFEKTETESLLME